MSIKPREQPDVSPCTFCSSIDQKTATAAAMKAANMIERHLKECVPRTHMSSFTISLLSQAEEEGGVLGTLPSFMSWLQRDSLRKPRIVIAICDLLNVHRT